MNALCLIVADANSERWRTALVTASAYAALGESVTLFHQGAAVTLLRHPIADPDQAAQQAAGLPSLGELVDEALGLGIVLSGCQSSLALLGLSIADCHPEVEWAGMVSILSSLKSDDRLLIV